MAAWCQAFGRFERIGEWDCVGFPARNLLGWPSTFLRECPVSMEANQTSSNPAYTDISDASVISLSCPRISGTRLWSEAGHSSRQLGHEDHRQWFSLKLTSSAFQKPTPTIVIITSDWRISFPNTGCSLARHMLRWNGHAVIFTATPSLSPPSIDAANTWDPQIRNILGSLHKYDIACIQPQRRTEPHDILHISTIPYQLRSYEGLDEDGCHTRYR